MPKAAQVATFADRLLRTAEIPDYPNALNGLQVGTDAEIMKIAAAVDFSGKTVAAAKRSGANLLIVHHGAFWGGVIPITGRRQDILSTLLQNSIGVYSSHLPLDCHPAIGNNVLLAKEFGLQPTSAFGKFSGVSIGVAGDSPDSLSELVESVEMFARMHGGSVRSTPFEKGRAIGQWAICSGGGADSDTLAEASARGIHTLIVGEGPHWTAVYAEENDIALIYAGHYASETLGVQALAAAISTEFGIAWEFLPSPTGT